jgi:hypothetical protein
MKGKVMAKTAGPESAKPKRKQIPPSIKDAILMEAGYKCGNPRCSIILAANILEDHHIQYVSESGRNELSNLLALCPNCHALHHSGTITHQAIRHWKGMLVALNHALGHRSMELLVYLKKFQDMQGFVFSADATLQFASLIAADLVHSQPTWVGSASGDTAPKWIIRLSARGQMLVDAWLAGDEDKYREAMNKLGVTPGRCVESDCGPQ